MTPWTVAHQAPLSMGFSRQEYWSGLLFLSPGDLPDPGTEPRSPARQADSLPTELPRELCCTNFKRLKLQQRNQHQSRKDVTWVGHRELPHECGNAGHNNEQINR